MNKKETNKLVNTKNKFRIQRLSNSLSIIKNANYEITLDNYEELYNTPSIGKGTIERIKEILETGTLKELNQYIPNKNIKLITEMIDVIGIGEKRANYLITKYNITSFDDFKTRVNNGDIDVNDKIKLGIKYHGKYHKKIPRSEMDAILLLIDNILSYDEHLTFVMCGSYRRELDYSGDIDILLVHDKILTQKEVLASSVLHDVVTKMHNAKFLVDDLTDSDKTKYMGFCKLNKNSLVRRIDIRMVGLFSFIPALLYFTGSYEFNQIMRNNAKKLGYKLNEYGLFKINTDKNIVVFDEKEIFDILHMKYLSPNER